MNDTPTELLLQLPSGAMRARVHGPASGRLVLGVPGLSANALTFDAIGKEMGAAGARFVAVDLRGRGRTPAGLGGSHGWRNHASDLLDVAAALGAGTFDLVGHSMGAFVGLTLAGIAAGRLRRLVLVDAVGVPDPRAMPPIIAAAKRLGSTYPSAEAFLDLVKSAAIVPWSPFWEAHYREDLVPAPDGGVMQRAAPAAIMEDLTYASTADVRALWAGVTVPSLLLRAGIPMGPGGFIITEKDRDGFVSAARDARVIEIDANHYGIMNHPATAQATREFLQ